METQHSEKDTILAIPQFPLQPEIVPLPNSSALLVEPVQPKFEEEKKVFEDNENENENDSEREKKTERRKVYREQKNKGKNDECLIFSTMIGLLNIYGVGFTFGKKKKQTKKTLSMFEIQSMKGEIIMTKEDIESLCKTVIEESKSSTMYYRKNCNYIMFNKVRELLETHCGMLFDDTNSKKPQKSIQVHRFSVLYSGNNKSNPITKHHLVLIGEEIYNYIKSLTQNELDRKQKVTIIPRDPFIESSITKYIKTNGLTLEINKPYWNN